MIESLDFSPSVSYLLQEWDQLLGVQQAFGQVREVIETILRLRQSVDTLERTNQQMAAATVFRESQGPVDPKTEGALLVVTEDNKGFRWCGRWRAQGLLVPSVAR